ncbi:hypothetical protein [Salinibaculum salinum]|uniref:hypothetical protein n=1 Tax=Salinibaculum salinum TaxID=3131996 RepID=UPI0030EF927B
MSGKITNQDGEPVDDATVRVTGVNYNNIVAESGRSLEERAEELIEESRDPLPPEFDRTLSVESDIINQESQNVPLAYDTDISASAWVDDADLSQPGTVLPADEELVFVPWDPEPPSGFAIQGEYDTQHPGKSADTGPIIAEQLSPTGDTVSTTKIAVDEEAGGGLGDPSSLEYGTAKLTPGIYRISVEGSDASYLISVGSPDALARSIEDDLRDEANQLTKRAQEIRDRFENNKFESTSATTNESGYYSVEVGESVKTVAVAAYHNGQVNISAIDPTNYGLNADAHPQTVLRALTNAGDLNGSVYLPARPTRYQAPTDNADVEMREVSFTPYENATNYSDRFQKLEGLFENQSQRLQNLFAQHNITRANLEEQYLWLKQISEQNGDLDDQLDKIANKEFDIDEEDFEINATTATDEELRERTAALEQTIDSLRNTIESDTSSSTGAETISSIATFQTALNDSQVQVLATYSNGTTKTVPDEYVTIDRSAGTVAGVGSTEVQVNDLPLGDAASVEFEWIAASPDGHASTTERISNPTINADAPDVDSVTLTSLAPGPSDRVSVAVNPDDESSFRELTAATVFAPNGTTLSTGAIQDGTRFNFTTASEGRHTLQLTYTDVDGNEWTKTVHIGADDADRARPASIKAQSGPTGIYALAADGLAGGEIKKRPGQLQMAAKVGQNDDVPTRIHAYPGDIQESPSGNIKMSVLREDGSSVSTRSRVIIHAQAMPEDGTYIYRNGQPLTDSQGDARFSSNQTLIETYTDANGQVTLDVRQPQGIAATSWERAKWEVAKLQVQVSGLVDGLGGTSISMGALLVVIPAGALARRRGRGGNGGAAA